MQFFRGWLVTRGCLTAAVASVTFEIGPIRNRAVHGSVRLLCDSRYWHGSCCCLLAMHGYGDWHMGWMGIWWILIVPVLIALVWFALSAGRRRDGAQESPEQVLKRHFANGELDSETYQRRLEELRK